MSWLGWVGPTSVQLVEVAPRDGLQNESVRLKTSVKVELIQRAVAAGIHRIEATAFVHQQRVPQLSDAEDVMRAVPRATGVSYIGLVLNRRGFERAVEAGVDEVNVVVLATDTFSLRNQGTTTEEALAVWDEISTLAQAAGLR